MTGRKSLREYYENRRNETDPELIKQYLEEGEGAIIVLTKGLMQIDVTEWDKYGNPVRGVANVRPELLQDPPMGNTLSSRDLSQMRKDRKAKEIGDDEQ